MLTPLVAGVQWHGQTGKTDWQADGSTYTGGQTSRRIDKQTHSKTNRQHTSMLTPLVAGVQWHGQTGKTDWQADGSTYTGGRQTYFETNRQGTHKVTWRVKEIWHSPGRLISSWRCGLRGWPATDRTRRSPQQIKCGLQKRRIPRRSPQQQRPLRQRESAHSYEGWKLSLESEAKHVAVMKNVHGGCTDIHSSKFREKKKCMKIW